ncbi:MAG: hypothetical protein WEB57_08260 [Pseudohongiellaceae bacterium]
MNPRNPFLTMKLRDGTWAGNVSSADRIRQVMTFDRQQCLAALEVDGLQKSVATAIKTRLRRLEREEQQYLEIPKFLRRGI